MIPDLSVSETVDRHPIATVLPSTYSPVYTSPVYTPQYTLSLTHYLLYILYNILSLLHSPLYTLHLKFYFIRSPAGTQ